MLKKRLAMGAIAAALLGSIVLAGGASAGGDATTRVTIKGGGEVFGYVSSSKPRLCAKNRLIKVWRERGGSQGGGDDTYTGNSDSASKSGDRYMWSVGNPGLKGKFYAKAAKIPGCKADTSPTIKID